MKKFFGITAIIIFFTIFRADIAFAYYDKIDIPDGYMTGDYDRGTITLDDIYNLAEEYRKGNIRRDVSSPLETYFPYLDKRSIDFFGNIKTYAQRNYYVKDSDSICFWFCAPNHQGDSHVPGYPFLISPFMEGGVAVDGNIEKLKEYIQDSKKLHEWIYGKVVYIKEHLEDSQYGGYYYEMGDGKVHIYLTDESKRGELETEGIICEKVEYSFEQIYEKMKSLWDKREKLGICYMWINYHQNRLLIYVKDEESKQAFADDSMLYAASVGNIYNLELKMGNEDTDELLEYLEFQNFYKDDSIRYAKLHFALNKLKEAYPEYDYVNLFYHVAKDLDYERYLNFPKELCEYVDRLPAYQGDVHFMNEAEFGDPERLEVKRMLREYKREYPNMSYQDIYETYIKEIEEDNRLSSAEKLYCYLYDKYTTVFENRAGLERKDTLPTAAFGSTALLIGGAVICRKKKNYQ